jgi:hypothetical protein
MRNCGLSALAMSVVLITPPALASADAVLIGEYGAWRAYKAEGDKLAMCFAASMPTSRTPEELRRDNGFVFVSYRKTEGIRDELSFVLGYPLKISAETNLTIGNDSFELMEEGEAAWLESVDQQGEVIERLRRERVASVKATSARGNETIDEYSLRGFTQAYKAMMAACK